MQKFIKNLEEGINYEFQKIKNDIIEDLLIEAKAKLEESLRAELEDLVSQYIIGIQSKVGIENLNLNFSFYLKDREDDK